LGGGKKRWIAFRDTEGGEGAKGKPKTKSLYGGKGGQPGGKKKKKKMEPRHVWTWERTHVSKKKKGVTTKKEKKKTLKEGPVMDLKKKKAHGPDPERSKSFLKKSRKARKKKRRGKGMRGQGERTKERSTTVRAKNAKQRRGQRK